jgi:lipopolysaccharide assembly outer membrane protein LptD (OstA)
MLILIIFFISNKYFNPQDKIYEKNDTDSLSKKIENVPNKKSDKENVTNEITNLSYQKFDTNGNKYLIKAKKGLLDIKNSDIIYMSSVEASLTYLNNEKLIIFSEEAIFNKQNFKTRFSKNVNLRYQDQTLESDYLEFLIDKNIAIFKDNVKYNNQNIEAFAHTIVINLLTKKINIESNNQKKIIIKTKN